VPPGELFSKDLARRQERGPIRAIPLQGSMRRIRAEELANLPIGTFAGFAPLPEDHDVVRVECARSIE
jgi:hypothetical protein